MSFVERSSAWRGCCRFRRVHVELTTGRYSILHDSGQRLVTVTFNVAGRALQQVVSEARATLSRDAALPSGVYLQFAGAAQAEQRTRNELLIYSGLALTVIIMILFVAFHWRANSWLVMANLPFSVIGSVFTIWREFRAGTARRQ